MPRVTRCAPVFHLPVPRLRAACVLAVFAVAGCHTSDDSRIAATQLSAASTALTAYYTALDTEMTEGAHAAALDQVLLPAQKDQYAKWRAEFERDHTEIQLRLRMAKALSGLADSFTALSGSTAPADANAAAARLQSALAALPGSASAAASNAPIPDMFQALTAALLEKKERNVAAAMSAVVDQIAKNVDTDKQALRIAHAKYLKTTSEGARALLASGQIDTADFSAGLANDVLAPYGLSAKLKDETADRTSDLIPHLIDEKSETAQRQYDDAQDAMQSALVTLAARLKDLSEGKNFGKHLPPLALNDVNNWSATVK